VCGTGGAWGSPIACGETQICDGAGGCQSGGCPSGRSPDWFSAAGGNASWNDPRWGGAALTPFAGGPSATAGGYALVFDRAANELAVTYRVRLGDAEIPNGSDRAYVSIRSNQAGSPAAHEATLTLFEMNPGEGPRDITAIQFAEYAGRWQPSTSTDWLHHASAWRASGDVSWVVSFRINLGKARIDPTLAFHMGVAVHVAGAARDLSTPADLADLHDQVNSWAAVNVTGIACVGRATLTP